MDHHRRGPAGGDLPVAAHVRRVLHRRPLVLVGQPPLGLAEAVRGEGRPHAGLQRHLRRASADQSAGRRAPRPEGPVDGRGGRIRQALPRGHRPLRPLAPGRRGGGPVADHRVPGARAVAELAAVPQRHAVQRRRPAVPPQRLVLRLHPALPAVRGPLDARRPGHGAAGDHPQPLPERRDPDAGLAPACPSCGQGPPVGHPRPHRAGEGGRLPAGPVQPRPVLERLRPGCRIHRRARPAPRPRAARRGVRGRGGAPHLQHPPTGVGAAHPRGRPVVPGGAHRRHHLPGGRAGAQGQSRPEHPRAPLHPAEHLGHPDGHGDHRRGEHRLPGLLQPLGHPAVGQRRHPGERAAVGPAPDPADLRQAPGHPVLLPVQHPGRGPLPGRQQGDRVGGRGP